MFCWSIFLVYCSVFGKNTQYSNERDRREREFVARGVVRPVVVSFLFIFPYGGRIRSIRTSATEGSASLLPAVLGVLLEYLSCLLFRMGERYAVSERARPKGARVCCLRCRVFCWSIFLVYCSVWWKDTQDLNERDRREREFISCGVGCTGVVLSLK